jgi:hypothetical protein
MFQNYVVTVVVQLYEYTKNHLHVDFKRVDFIVLNYISIQALLEIKIKMSLKEHVVILITD